MVDKAFVGRIPGQGAESLAAVGTSTLITLFTLTILLTTLIGTIIIILRYIGAGEDEEASHYSAQSLLASLFLGIGIGMLWYLGAGRIFKILHAPDDVRQIGEKYLQVLGLFCPVIVINFMTTGLLRFSGDTVKSMIANTTMVLINLFGDYVLIFGHWGFPKMGVAGAALAAGIANSVGLIISISFLFSGRSTIKLGLRHFTDFRMSTFRRIMGKGIPVTTEQLIGTGAYLVVVRYSMRLGSAAAAAHQAIISFSWISTMFYLGIGTATTAITGKSLGANEEDVAERTGRVASNVAICFGIIFGGILFSLSRPIMRVFLPPATRSNILAIKLGASCLKIVAFIQIPKAINTVLASSLRGAGDVRWLVFVNIIGAGVGDVFLARALGVGMLIAYPTLGLPGIWVGTGTGEAIRVAMNYLRYRQGRWKNITV